MKKHLLPFLFLAIMFTACQEPGNDVDMPVPEKAIEKQIIGKWELVYTNFSYLDEHGLPHPQSDNLYSLNQGGPFGIFYTFDEDVFINSTSSTSGEGQEATYSIYKEDGEHLIKFSTENQPEIETSYTIASIKDSAMIWKREFINSSEEINQEESVIVPLVVETVSFKRIK